MTAVLAVGVLLGYLAASRGLNPWHEAGAAGPPAPGATEKPADPGGSGQAACCSEGLNKGQVLALAGKERAGARARAGKKPNIVFIMGDDVGWFNIGAYHQGIMAGRTPNLDRLAAEGMRFTDYYAEASCTAGRANFITGQLPIRTGLRSEERRVGKESRSR